MCFWCKWGMGNFKANGHALGAHGHAVGSEAMHGLMHDLAPKSCMAACETGGRAMPVSRCPTIASYFYSVMPQPQPVKKREREGESARLGWMATATQTAGGDGGFSWHLRPKFKLKPLPQIDVDKERKEQGNSDVCGDRRRRLVGHVLSVSRKCSWW